MEASVVVANTVPVSHSQWAYVLCIWACGPRGRAETLGRLPGGGDICSRP